MAPKKKPAKDDGSPDLFDEFKKKYDKTLKEYDGLQKLSSVVEFIAAYDAGEPQNKWYFDREFDPMAFRVTFQTLTNVQFPEIDAIWLWKCAGKDESVRSVCYYLDMDPSPEVKDVQFCDNGVTELGCEFLGRTLGPNGNKVVNLLRLDYNQFGTAGVNMLSRGLSQNATLRQLSLNYCNIGEDGGEYIAHILMFVRGALEVLELKGNYLQDKGICDVFNGARRSKTLQKIDVFDNKFTDLPMENGVVKSLRELFANNTTLTSYKLGGNQISDQGASMLVNGMIGKGHLAEVMITERCSQKTFEGLESVLSMGKGKKKGKKRK